MILTLCQTPEHGTLIRKEYPQIRIVKLSCPVCGFVRQMPFEVAPARPETTVLPPQVLDSKGKNRLPSVRMPIVKQADAPSESRDSGRERSQPAT